MPHKATKVARGLTSWRRRLGAPAALPFQLTHSPCLVLFSYHLPIGYYLFPWFQAGIVPEVIPEIQKSAAAPFGLTSFALSTLLVLR